MTDRLVPKQTYASPMSFVGSGRRMSGWARRHGWWAWLFVAPALAGFWLFLCVWYLVVFGVFGIVTVPLRLHRRGQRKAQATAEAQLAEMRKLTADR